MFDQAPQNLPTEAPEDIFAPTDVGAPAPIAKPRVSTPTNVGTPPSSLVLRESSRIIEPFLTRGRIVASLLIFVFIVGVVLFVVFRKGGEPAVAPEVPAALPVPIEAPPAPVAPAEAPVPTGAVGVPALEAVPTPPVAPVDSDADGLSDIDEAQIGTDAQKTDTDGDGLTDREEVAFWKTNPKNPDTDGDSYLDGVEVSGGYNPNGPGKLITPPMP